MKIPRVAADTAKHRGLFMAVVMHIESRATALAPIPIDIDASSIPSSADVPANAAVFKARVSCVVPAYNEADNLAVLLPALMVTLSGCCIDWEVIVCDDGSSDDTAQIMGQWTAVKGFRYVQLSRNFGKEAAISAGLDSASGDVIICMDADMQHPPSLIPKMLARWQAGAEMVYAVRENRNDESWAKRVGARGFYRLLNQSQGVRVPAHAGDFRLMDRRVVDALIALPERTRFMKGLYAWVGFKTEALDYTPAERAHGVSRFSPIKLTSLALDGLTAFTTWPLRMLSVVGSLFAVASIAYGTFLVIDYWRFGNETSGWTTIVAALLFFAGINLISLGVLGEYIGRIFNEVKGRPLYVVRSRTGRSFTADSPLD